LNDHNRRRRAIASQYDHGLAGIGLILPTIPNNYRHAYHQYTILSHDRDALALHLKAQNITAAVLYPLPIHQQPAYQPRRFAERQNLSISERICASLLCLPMHPMLTDEQVERVIEATRQWALHRE